MARPVDAEALEKKISEWLGQPGNGDYYSGYDAALCAVQDLIADTPTLTPPNEWVNRVRELDELYTKLQIVTGFTAEQLLEIFAAGYTLEKPDYSKKFAEMENLAEAAQPNDPLTIEQLREMDGEPVWVVPTGMHEKDEPMWCVLESPVALIPGVDYWSWDFDGYGETWLAYRRPPEGEKI